MEIFNFNEILTNFSNSTVQGLYKRISYQDWRKLKKIGNHCEIYYNIPQIKIFSCKTTEDDEYLAFNINDESFGTYLYSRYFASNSDMHSFLTKPTGVCNCSISNSRVDTLKNDIAKEKENKNMFDKFDFGPITNNTVRFSPYGMSILNDNGEWVSYDVRRNQIVETDGFTFEMENMLYKIPVAVKDVRPGDMIVHNGNYVYVIENTNGNIKVVNITAGEQRVILPPSNMFGFNFVTKIVSMLDMAGLGCGTPTAEQPFGNILPMLIMSQMFGDKSKNKNNDFGQIMMMSMLFNGQNPFMNMFTGFAQKAPLYNPPVGACACANSGATINSNEVPTI